ncbi:MAG: hypothetical protein RL885_18835 [Planctomycetota bacterium]
MKTKLIALASALLLGGLMAQSASAQEELNPEEIRRLIRQITRDMKSAEEIIIQTGSGAREAQQRVVENIDKLVQQGKDTQGSILEGIDQLIEQAKYQQQQQQQSQQQGGSESESQGGSQQPQRGSRRREGQRNEDLVNTGRDQQQQQGEQQQERDQQGQDQQKDQSGRPDGPQEGQRQNQQQQGGTPPEGETGDPSSQSGAGRWGDLPEKVQERISTYDPNQYPQKYRKWLNDYLRRLNDVDR